MSDTDVQRGVLKQAARSSREFMDSCDPGWTDDRIAVEPEGSEFLRIRSEIRTLDQADLSDDADITPTLLTPPWSSPRAPRPRTCLTPRSLRPWARTMAGYSLPPGIAWPQRSGSKISR